MKLVATLLAADPDDEMWAWGRDQQRSILVTRQFDNMVHAWTSSSRPK